MAHTYKPITLIRKIGSNGRFVIPQDLRLICGLEDGCKIAVTLSEEGIFIRPLNETEDIK